MTELPQKPDDNEQKRLDLVHNERTKLTATWLNNLGVGALVAGFIAPSITLLTLDGTRLIISITMAVTWILIGLGLHLLGRWFMRSLRQ
jgi:hypothetical protein